MNYGGEKVFLGNWDGDPIWRPLTAEERLEREYQENIKNNRAKKELGI